MGLGRQSYRDDMLVKGNYGEARENTKIFFKEQVTGLVLR